jgi:hypothetical protein
MAGPCTTTSKPVAVCWCLLSSFIARASTFELFKKGHKWSVKLLDTHYAFPGFSERVGPVAWNAVVSVLARCLLSPTIQLKYQIAWLPWPPRCQSSEFTSELLNTLRESLSCFLLLPRSLSGSFKSKEPASLVTYWISSIEVCP